MNSDQHLSWFRSNNATSQVRPFRGPEKQMFFVGLILKIVIGTIFASPFLLEYFIPFVSYFTQSAGSNPYEHFTELGRPEAFPYPAGMLYILSIAQVWFNIDGGITVLNLLAIRLILLACDTTIYFVLRSWLSGQAIMRLLWLYWFSPVVIYICYIHGQLDAIPICFLTLSLFALFRHQVLLAGVMFGVALATKTNVALVFPLFLIFLHKKEYWDRNFLIFCGAIFGTFLLINSAYLTNVSFLNAVLFNDEQKKVFLSYFSFREAKFYIVPACWLSVIGLGARSGLGNRDLLVIFMGFTFCVILVFIPPMYGWYFWIMPAFAFFFAREKNSTTILFFLVQFLYFVYFLFEKDSGFLDFFGVLPNAAALNFDVYAALESMNYDAALLNDLAFTALQTSLLLMCLQIYLRGIKRFREHKITGTPLLVGIGGNSGVGKSSLTSCINEIFNPKNVTILRGDDRHKWQRGDQQWDEFTHLDPKANNLHREVETLRSLRALNIVRRQIYDHDTGTFSDEKLVFPKRIILLEGLHPFYISHQRELFDFKISVVPDPYLALHWKICRDLEKRKYTIDEIHQQVQKRHSDSQNFIDTQTIFADLILKPISVEKIENVGDSSENIDVYYEITLKNSFGIEPAIALLESFSGIAIEHSYKDTESQIITLRGNCTDADCKNLSDYFSSRLQEIGVTQGVWPRGLMGAVAFIIIYCIYEVSDRDKAR